MGDPFDVRCGAAVFELGRAVGAIRQRRVLVIGCAAQVELPADLVVLPVCVGTTWCSQELPVAGSRAGRTAALRLNRMVTTPAAMRSRVGDAGRRALARRPGGRRGRSTSSGMTAPRANDAVNAMVGNPMSRLRRLGRWRLARSCALCAQHTERESEPERLLPEPNCFWGAGRTAFPAAPQRTGSQSHADRDERE